MKLSLKRQLLASTIIPIIVMACILTLLSAASIISTGQQRMHTYREILLNEKKMELKNYVEIMMQAIQGKTDEEALQTVRTLKYQGASYFWINDFNHFMVAHPDPRLEGTDANDLKDPNGFLIIQEAVKACKEKGEGYLEYSFAKPGSEELFPKLSYVKTLNNGKWILGTGIYIDNIDSVLAVESEKTRNEMVALVTRNVAISLLLLAAVSLIITLFVNRNLNRPMQVTIGTLQDSGNDLTVTLPEDFKYEFSELAHWYNHHVEHLHDIIKMVADATLEVNSSVSEISTAVEEQAVISNEQSASVSQITSTMEEFSGSSTQIAEHANSVADVAARTLEKTRKGATTIETFIQKMEEIHSDNQSSIKEIIALGRKSKEINKVMEIINNIADQTKLIAFNAILEASSAGEAGKRFGVVAMEVRRLADNVMASTREIEDKINEIQEAVNRLVITSEKGSKGIQEGVAFTKKTSSLLVDIVSGTELTAGAAKEISLSTQQQKTASSQVVTALREILEGAKQTSLSLQQVSTATHDLKNLSQKLKSLVEQFKLKEDA